ncbi:hypothetical protein Taro_047475 [Colocasia esculenta]|uniref:Uncharacterized protein n=1 Tax=Colocasia esculenta TaxID=4460 RepID=A0A843X5H0_COLES|nr:hypothetical protein [Colocasia esculenta]
MGKPQVVRKRVHALRRAPDGSAFQIWESYMKNCKGKEWIEIGRLVFETWANMAPKEKQPFVKQAEQIEDEADSSMVGKFDPDYEEPSDYDEHLQWGHHISFESFDSFDDRFVDLLVKKQGNVEHSTRNIDPADFHM